LSRLPAPNVIEPLDFESILAEQLVDLEERDSAFAGLQESDRAMKVLQVTAYRELKVRQRINEAARVVMSPYRTNKKLIICYGFFRLL
jgi:phage-related baseplate assembly protein